ncbi:sensor histidine kinase [Actinophytocola sp. NPDC049390]|uniref:sensor histidine kinase n=1 Tax=Actinophytocola sp. NPDC049390 TaxID=3363894 RepID=UPI00379DFB66
MAAVLDLVLGPVIRPSTYRRWVYLILGGAVLVPFMLIAGMVLPSLMPAAFQDETTLVVALSLVLVLGVMVLMSLIPAVRVIEGTAARELLGDGIPEQATTGGRSWESRARFAGWFVLHLLVGGILSVLTLTVPPTAVLTFFAPFVGRVDALGLVVATPRGWAGAWVPLAGLAGVLVLVHLVVGAAVLATRAAPFLLGPPATERLAELEQRTERLAERNRLARELHDSVGHALSVVTIQASAAGRVLDSDPEFARTALSAIEESARAALADLDHVLGLLREETSAGDPQWTLANLPTLLEQTRIAGVAVESTVEGALDRVPPAVSREAYRIVQEGLTNVLRHAGRVPVELRLAARGDRFELDLSNPIDEHAGTRAGGGHGLSGMRERVTVLRGQMTAGPDEGRWRVQVRIPLRTVRE